MLAALKTVPASQLPGPELDELQYTLWMGLLEQRLGLATTAQSRGFISSQLRIRMRELGIDTFDEYYRLVTTSPRAAQEWSHLLDRLTIHETRFNRHAPSFRFIEEVYLPQLLEQSHEVVNLRAWSVGCASGEEAYYLAMLLDWALADYPGKAYFGVFGTDISLSSLSQARQGCYREERLRDLNEVFREDYFEPCEEGARVIERLRKRVAFSQLNVQALLKAPFDAMDIIFCQNLLIYFPPQKRREIVSRLAGFLKPGGVMLLGVGEVTGWHPQGVDVLKVEDTLAFRKRAD